MLLIASTAALTALGLGATHLLTHVSRGHIYAMGCGLHGRGERGTDGAPGPTRDTAGNAARGNARLPLACDYALPYHRFVWSCDLIGAASYSTRRETRPL